MDFSEVSDVRFNGDKVEIVKSKPIDDGSADYSYAIINPDHVMTVVKRFRTPNSVYQKADEIKDVSVESWSTPVEDAEALLPKDVVITTSNTAVDGVQKAEITWDMTNYVPSDLNNRKAHDVEVTGTLTMPKNDKGETAVDLPKDGDDHDIPATVTAKIKVPADPRLEKEAAAAKLDEEAKAVIEKAKNAGVGADEIAALENALDEMRKEVSEDNLDKSTDKSDQEKIDAVNTNLDALKKLIGDKEKADEEKKANTVNESVGIRQGSNEAAVDKFLMNRATDSDPVGSTVAPLKVKSTKQTKKSIKLTWAKTRGAAKYVVYGNQCGKTKKLKKLATVKGMSLNVKKINGKKLKKGKYHKFIVVAFDKNNKVVATSKIVHIATKGGKNGNHKKVTVSKKVVKKAKNLKAGKTLKLKAKAVGKRVKKHRAVIYETSNAKVATVSKKGVVKGVGKGSCYVYAYAQNGVMKAVKITVK